MLSLGKLKYFVLAFLFPENVATDEILTLIHCACA